MIKDGTGFRTIYRTPDTKDNSCRCHVGSVHPSSVWSRPYVPTSHPNRKVGPLPHKFLVLWCLYLPHTDTGTESKGFVGGIWCTELETKISLTNPGVKRFHRHTQVYVRFDDIVCVGFTFPNVFSVSTKEGSSCLSPLTRSDHPTGTGVSVGLWVQRGQNKKVVKNTKIRVHTPV